MEHHVTKVALPVEQGRVIGCRFSPLVVEAIKALKRRESHAGKPQPTW